ncbi:hypothetical protein SEA_VANLEE_121 [Gordonia phage VanLee]|uniref:DUF932 domain-containing protein n=1 Tax=Gordonia phage VanLee TaxID=2845816 RepID=A0A8F2IFF5_9CAUD|nr:hypothetical protein QEH49_gp121 [Gordonia phage VanLee]QWS68238.1 hypothetical protein SEA_VANLEE_121 [Gordonia phage VanLee]
MTTPTATLPERTLRGADLAQLLQVLQHQHSSKVDVVMPAAQLNATLTGGFEFAALPPKISESGVTDVAGIYTPTPGAIGHLADKFGIPLAYLRKLSEQHQELFAANVNGWAVRDDRKFLVRLLHGQHDDGQGLLRAVLSDGYGFRDHIDTVMALLSGMRAAGLEADNIGAADLSDNRLYLRVRAPEISVMAPELLKGYRSPFTGAEGADNPVVYAGLLVRNSETGGGALSITPELRVQVCDNGLQITPDAIRSVHLGSRLEEGQVNWSADTQDAYDDLITKKVRDAVTAFLTPEYVRDTVAKITEKAAKPLEDPKQIEVVATQLKFNEGERAALLSHFIKGGQMTAGGVMNAVTSMCQEISDPDRSHEVQATGLKALDLAAAL